MANPRTSSSATFVTIVVVQMKVPPLESVCTISKTEARIEITPKIVMRLTSVSLRARSKSSCCSANMLIFVLTSETKVGVCNLKRKCGANILHSKGFRIQECFTQNAARNAVTGTDRMG